MRPGETLSEIKFKQIGVVHTNATHDEIRSRTPGIESVVEVFPEFEEAMEGLGGFSHLFVLVYFDKLRSAQIGPLKVRPRHMMPEGYKLEDIPLVGVFALDSPTRPNPIGLCLVSLKRIEGRNLVVSDLGCFDGTPVLDIKPYQSTYRVDNFTEVDLPGKLLGRAGPQ